MNNLCLTFFSKPQVLREMLKMHPFCFLNSFQGHVFLESVTDPIPNT